ncbi:MAG: hypothetical protein K6W08_12915 [Firmicutes bacterium]|nr:hypothetical protein [Bacillota bacterium]
MQAPDDQALAVALVTLVRWAGQPLADPCAARVLPIVAGSLRDWGLLAGTVNPEAEPLWCGRWPEAGDE